MRSISEAELTELVNKHATIKEMALYFDVGFTTIRYWLKKYQLRTKRGPHGKIPKDMVVPRHCACGETDPSKFYGHKRTVCGICHNRYTLAQGQARKQRVREYLGGCCQLCGFAKYTAALHVHHKDPSKKSPNFNTSRGWSWTNLLKELQHCVLLCANCHAALHNNELPEGSLEARH